MKKLVIVLVAICSFLHADPLEVIPLDTKSNLKASAAVEPFEINLATLGGEPSSIIHGCVNAISGSFIESSTDLVAPGPEPLAVHRVYTNLGGWSINYPEMVEKRTSTIIHMQNGMTSSFKKKGDYFWIRPENFRNGLTNCSTAIISGRTNPHSFRFKEDSDEYHYTLQDGGKSIKKFKERILCHRRVNNQAEGYFGYLLAYEIKPTGLRTEYSYQNSPLGWAIQEIHTLNFNKQKLNSISYDYSHFATSSSMIAYANENRSGHCEYKYKNSNLSSVVSLTAPPVSYEYDETTKFMRRKIHPDQRIMEIDYYDEVNPYMAVKDKENSHYGRVFSLKSPVGKDAQLYTTHRFFYEIQKNPKQFHVTRVFDILNQETRYSFDSDTHLRSIEELGPQNRACKFYWYEKETPFDGNLMTKTLEDSSGKITSCHHYIYDERGNILESWLFGNLTGKNQTSPVLNKGIPYENGCDRYLKRCTYSDDGYNHLLTEEDGRKIIQYLYAPKNDLVQAKLIADITGKIRYREFYTYNVNGALTRIVADDGCLSTENDSSITERHITTIQYREQFPIGLPQIIEEKYLDINTNKEKLLTKVENFHDALGRIVQQNHYNADNKLRYSLKWEYDLHGNVLKETNPLGYTSTYSYDANDNLITEQHPGNPFYTLYTYDYANRMISSEDVHSDFILSTRYDYNLLSQKTSSFDWQGNETNFVYDRLGRVIQTIHPAVIESGNVYRPVECTEYDNADNPVVKIDPSGNRTDFLYNVRGQPCIIRHPDGAVERNEYTIDGLLEKNIALNGTTTHFEYDYMGRLCRKEIRSPDGQLLSTCSAVYNHFHKLYEIDSAGHRTDFQYDAAGRLICITKGVVKTKYHYDNCQRLIKTLEYFGPGENDFIAKVQEYDVMDRIIEERTEDSKCQILTRFSSVYNERGECIQSLSYHQTKPTITTLTYNAYGDVEKVTDPQENTTQTHFYYSYITANGQCVFAKETVDPLGNILFLEYDPLSRLKFEIKKNAMGLVLQKREFIYDACGNCVRQIEHVFTPGEADKRLVHAFEFDCNHQLIRWIEAAGTPEQRQTRYAYNFYHQKTTTVKPDGVELYYLYDWLGRLSSFKSSDESIHYQYNYDANSNIIQVDDLVHHTSTTRKFDENNRMTEETQANGLTVKYAYDSLARPLQMTLPDQSMVTYEYNSLHLSKVKRGDFTHTYLTYNQAGLLEKAQMIGKSGHINYTIDSCKRLTKIRTKKWEEQIPKNGFDKAGNLLEKVTHDDIGENKAKFTYNTLYQLTSEKGHVKHTFAYDSLYNLVQLDKTNHQINALNQLLNDGFEKCTYDQNGCLIQKGKLKFTYDALDRLASVVDGEKKITYTYDDLNRRLSTTTSSGTVRYIYQGKNEIGACDETGRIKQLRVLGLGKGAELGASILFELDDCTFAPVHDISGNVCALIDPFTGKTVETYRYSAFGKETLYDNTSRPISHSISPWRFASKRTDDETGFVYFGERYYNPEISRWVTADPLGLSAGPNMYTYLFNNPLNNCDLYGLEKCFGEDQFCHRHCLSQEASRQERRPLDTHQERTHLGFMEICNGFWNGVKNTPANFVKAAGKFIYDFCHEMIPVPIIKDIGRVIGHLMQGKSISSYTMSYREQHSFKEVIRGNGASNHNVVTVNGMGVSAAEAIDRAKKSYYELGGNYDVYISYNASHGFVADLFECIGQLIGICTHSSDVFKETLTTATSSLGDYGMTFLNCHSQGGLIAFDASRTLSKSITNRVNAYTIGSPVALSDGDYRTVKNFAADSDPVSWGTRTYNAVKSVFNSSTRITTLRTKESVLKSHSYLGNAYQKAQALRMFEIRNF